MRRDAAFEGQVEPARLRVDLDVLNAAFFFQAEDGIRDGRVTGVQTCALPISRTPSARQPREAGSMWSSSTRQRSRWRKSPARSEERRVGKECRTRRSAYR